MSNGVVESWSVADVERLLSSLDLGHLAPLFRDNGVSGKDLLTFGNSEYLDILGCTKIQMHKIRGALIANGATTIKVDDSESSGPEAKKTGHNDASNPFGSTNPFAASAASAPPSSTAAYPNAYPPQKDPFAPGPDASPYPPQTATYPPPFTSTPNAVPSGYTPYPPSPAGMNPAQGNPYPTQPGTNYPTPAPSYPCQGNPYPPQPGTNYPTPAPSYPGQGNPYPTQPGTNYPTSAPSYPGQGNPYPTQPGTSYPTSAPGYPASPAGYGAAMSTGAAPATSQQDKAKIGQARQMLNSALSELQQADQLLRRASTTATMGMVQDMRGPGLIRGPQFGMRGALHHRNGNVLDLAESMEVKNASRHVQVASQSILDAKTVCPELPDIDMATVKNLRPGIVFEGGMLTEMLRKKKIEDTHRSVQAMMQQVQRAMHWCAAKMQ